MRMSDARHRAGEAAQATGRAFRTGGQAGGRATRRTAALVHRLTGAQGADRTGLGTLIEMTAVSGAADAFVTVALAGTIFFSTSVDQARGRVVLFLIITMAPFALLAPFIGPALDRIQQGRKFVLAGTMLTRGLLCYAMSANVANSVTLLPAAFGILVLQKAGGVVKASVTPRLLPAETTLVTVNARSGLISIATSTAAAGLAAGVQYSGGAAWTLRAGTLIYLAAMVLALRLPGQVDVPLPDQEPVAAPLPTRPDLQRPRDAAAPTLPLPPGSLPDAALPDGARTASAGRGHWRTLASVGPVVAEAMAVNAVLRAFSGYILFLLVFLVRSVNLGTVLHHPVSHNLALGALALGLSAGSLLSMVLGSFFRGRAPQLIMFSVLTIAPVVTAVCAWSFGLLAAVVVEFTAIFCASLAKLGQDSIVGTEIGDEIRSSTFSVSETLNQVANVAGGLAGVLVSMLDNGQAGLAIAAGGLVVALVLLTVRRRQRTRLTGASMPPPPARPAPAQLQGKAQRTEPLVASGTSDMMALFAIGRARGDTGGYGGQGGWWGREPPMPEARPPDDNWARSFATAVSRSAICLASLGSGCLPRRYTSEMPSSSFIRSSMIGIISSGFVRGCLAAAATTGGDSRTRTWSAWAPLRPSTMPNSTRWPFPRASVPAGSAEECTKTSPPSSRWRKPNPFSASYHLTLPVGTSKTSRRSELASRLRRPPRDVMGAI